ncbi:hypothetical protein [Thermomonospora cellulosilytica]|uniref:Uncharacterized protein n=1 Tax=Thermomonospora cellulosilytica TaxID=1411118 RepID=A0A7W3MVA3_9ACTN|nr:hypothetical protein [Thermomonospora cellulosilytica]MBA9002482.1 hypothetical protein [Thermomonospora cellulosilytica]
MTLRRNLRAAAAAAALVVMATGCSVVGGGEDSSGASPTAKATPVAGVDPGKVVAKATFPSPLADGATVDVKIHGLHATGRLAVLAVSLTPHVPGGYDDDISPYDVNGDRGLYPYLVDVVNLKRHVVLKDAGGRELGSDDVFTNGRNNTPMYLRYTYAAPPENVSAMDVYIGEWPPFRNIPLER